MDKNTNQKCPMMCNEILRRTIGDYLNIYTKDFEILPLEKSIGSGDNFCEITIKKRGK